MLKLSKANITGDKSAALRVVGIVVGMAAVWMSVFKRMLYPVLHSFYRDGGSGEYGMLAQGVYAAVLLLAVLALLVFRSRVRTGLVRHRFVVALTGLLGALGVVLLVHLDASAVGGVMGIVAGGVLASVYVPVHFVYWLLFILPCGQKDATRCIVLSFALFCCAFLALELLGANTSTVSVACPIISAAMVLAIAQPAEAHASEAPVGEAHADEAHEAHAGEVRAGEAHEALAETQVREGGGTVKRTVFDLPDKDGLPDGFADAFGLSERESELASYAYRNLSARSISKELFIAESTVYTHLKRIYRKTDVHSKQELIELIDGWHA